MKKKILATLLAVCLFVGVATTAVFAATSDAAGDAKKVSKITLDASAYEITVGGPAKDFSKHIAVYENDTKLVLDSNHIQYTILANVGSTSDFSIVGSEVTALRVGATATLTVYDNYSQKARTTATIKAVAPVTPVGQKIESFTFETSLNSLPVGTGAEVQSIVIEAHPKGTVFNDDAIAATDTKVITAIKGIPGLSAATVTPGIADGGKKRIYTIDDATLTGITAAAVNHSLEVTTVPNFVTGKAFTAKSAVRFVPAVRAMGISVPQELTVKVGERIDQPKVTYYPTNANVGKHVGFAIQPYINDGNAYEYAVIDGDKVLGVNSNAPAKARLQVTLYETALKAKAVSATEAMVNVKPANFVGQVTPTLPATASVEVGKTVTLAISNLPAGVTATWKSDADATATVKDGVVTGVKAGDVKVTATLSTGEVLVCTVTVKDAAPVTPTKPTTNPQTGDSLFANLF